ncbi:hypothetical protein [Caniella muris]|uniref:hypothetical protein n=1 Tax=Caniella muris TaxID=2941502 RepID=UPI00203D3A3E|nr:hypothetical protein [Caniella muris]
MSERIWKATRDFWGDLFGQRLEFRAGDTVDLDPAARQQLAREGLIEPAAPKRPAKKED